MTRSQLVQIEWRHRHARPAAFPLVWAICPLLLVSVGCTYSLHPLLAPSDLTEEYDLSGVWSTMVEVSDTEHKELRVELVARSRSTYGLTFQQGAEMFFGLTENRPANGTKKDHPIPKEWQLQIGKLGGKHYIQLITDPDLSESPFVGGVPVYLLARVEVDGDQLKVYHLDDANAADLADRIDLPRIVHELGGAAEFTTLTMSTKELQRVITHHGDKLFQKKPMTYRRVRERPDGINGSTRNMLADARISGNLESFHKGLRGAPDHVVYDPQQRRFLERSTYHEYGVGFGENLGVVPESRAAQWVAEWPKPIEANWIALSGVYPNQPQPKTAWKIELRSQGKWTVHARGVGGWYDRGRYTWGGVDTAPIELDALRVSLFSSDDKVPLRSIHFRGESSRSWIVARLVPLDAWFELPLESLRAGQEVAFTGRAIEGEITGWKWDFGDGTTGDGASVQHRFRAPGEYVVVLTFSNDEYSGSVRRSVHIGPPVSARIVPLDAEPIAGRPVAFSAKMSAGDIRSYRWDFGDGKTAEGLEAQHVYTKAGVYRATLTVSDGESTDRSSIILRLAEDNTMLRPAVLLDTDQKNEQDDQHYLAYALFAELDLLGVNSVHHGGGQEKTNYAEILHVIELARKSGLPVERVPMVFHGADRPLDIPPTFRWTDTDPVVTDASRAILAAARGTPPGQPVWVVPVGPGTNVASAILQARSEGLDLAGRLRVMWLGGTATTLAGEFNGDNDPWSAYVITQSGVETWIMPAPLGALVAIDKRTEGNLYPDHPLGRYLKQIVPAKPKALFDPSCISAVLSLHRRGAWVRRAEPVVVEATASYRYIPSRRQTSVRVIREIDHGAMKVDLFHTLRGERQPTRNP